MPYEPSGDALKVYIPNISDVANIQAGLRTFYYGTESAVNDVNLVPTESVAGRIIEVANNSVIRTNGTAYTSLTIESLSASSPTLALKTTGGTVNVTVSTPLSGTTSLVLPSSGTVITSAVTTLDSLASAGSSVGTLTLGGASTTTFNIANVNNSSPRTVNIGTGNPSSTKTINIGTGGSTSTTAISIGTSNATLSTTGTLSHTGAASFSSTLGVTGAATLSSTLSVTGAVNMNSTLSVTGALTAASLTLGAGGPIISTGSGTPSGSVNGSLYLRTGQGMESTLYIRSTTAPNWTAVRGTKWYSGTTDSPSYSDAQHGDFYLNRSNGKVFQYSST